MEEDNEDMNDKKGSMYKNGDTKQDQGDSDEHALIDEEEEDDVVLDGTYIYIQKSANYTLQKRTLL